MNPIDLMLYLLLFALVIWLINTLLNLPTPLKVIMNVFLAVLVIAWLLHVLGYHSALLPKFGFR